MTTPQAISHFNLNVVDTQSPPDSYGSQVSILTLSDGSKVVLKICATEVRFERELKGLQLAAGHDLPVSKILDHKLPDNDTGALLLEYMPGNPISRAEVTPAQAAAAGKILAQVHSIPSPLPVSEQQTEFNTWWDTSIKSLNDWIERLTPKMADPELIHQAADHIRKNPVKFNLDFYSYLHSDCRPGNFLADDSGRIIALIDWESSRFGDHLWDFVKVSNEFWITEEHKQAFLTAYTKIKPTPNLEAIHTYLVLNAFGSMDWAIRSNDNEYYEVNLERLENLLK